MRSNNKSNSEEVQEISETQAQLAYLDAFQIFLDSLQMKDRDLDKILSDMERMDKLKGKL